MVISAKLLAALALLVASLIAVRMISGRNKDASSPVSVDDLFIGEDGKMSKAAFVMYIALALTSWIMVLLTLTGKMTEGYMLIYGGLWVAPTIAKLFNRPVDLGPASRYVSNQQAAQLGQQFQQNQQFQPDQGLQGIAPAPPDQQLLNENQR